MSDKATCTVKGCTLPRWRGASGKNMSYVRCEMHERAAWKPRKTKRGVPKASTVKPGTVLVVKAEYHNGRLKHVKYDLVSDRETLANLLNGFVEAQGSLQTTSSQYIGVRKNRNRWAAAARIEGKVKHIGSYDTPEEAARAYDAFVIDNQLDRPLNFPGATNDTEAA